MLRPVDADGEPAPPPGAQGDDFQPVRYGRIASASVKCDAEDANGNRALDGPEDINRNGRLDPQDRPCSRPWRAATGIATLGTGSVLTTGADGAGHFRMVYPKGNAGWVMVRVTARASHLGAEARDSLLTSLPALVEDVAHGEGRPPNLSSPYGEALDCADPG